MLFEIQHQRKDGTHYPVEVNLQLAKEYPPVFAAIIQDITERKEILHTLRESEERFHTLARVSLVGIFQTDAEGRCLYVNQRWCTIADLDTEHAMGNGWADALHPQDRERVFREWQAAAQSNAPFQSVYRFKRSDDSFT